MKLENQERRKFIKYLRTLNADSFNLLWLQNILPKTTLKILISIYKREMLNTEAEKIALRMSWVKNCMKLTILVRI